MPVDTFNLPLTVVSRLIDFSLVWLVCHPRAGGDLSQIEVWIPACAGMTSAKYRSPPVRG